MRASSDGAVDLEREALLPQQEKLQATPTPPSFTCRSTSQLVAAFIAGSLACLVGQYIIFGADCFSPSHGAGSLVAPPYAGSSEVHPFPVTKPTNAFPSLFPTNVGYAGITPTGAEPALIATAPAYPLHTGAPALVPSGASLTKPKFDIFRLWGNLSPWYSVGRKAFGLDTDPEAPDTCRITGLHLLHRHGARYPTTYASYGGPSKLAAKLHAAAASWNGTDELEFLNEWTYKLGEEILTPFGRQQLYDLGISMRLKYGFLLKNFTESNTIPVFRTESQDRMLSSALNFALGFFGYPLEGQYQQSITIEARGFNNTLAPYTTCPNADIPSKADRGTFYVQNWANVYLKDAHKRLQSQLHGLTLTIEDVYTLQQMCAYETVAIGYSKFCELFTEDEWEGFNYALDLAFWYNSAFGSPLAKTLGIGWVQELVARLTHTPISVHSSSTNATLDDNDITFPLGQSLYVDATHEVVVLYVLTALNLTSLAGGGPLPWTHIPKDRTFRVAQVAPFATNVQFQLLSCDSSSESQIRIIVNDGVVPLTGVKGCPEQADGMCPLDTFVAAQKEIIAETDWVYGCYGDWHVPPGTEWNTTTGSPPPPV